MNDNLQEYINECYLILDSLNIPYYDKTLVIFKWNNRISTKWGYCRKNNDNTFMIAISSCLREDSIKHNKVLSVILHEILHTCPGCFNHGELWMCYAKLIKQNYGIKIKEVATAEDLGVPYQYRIKCKDCKYKMYFPMKPTMNNRKCPVCHSNNLKLRRKCYEYNGKRI